MKICMTRHGETEWNAKGLLQGHEDIPLNENGRAQALKLAKHLAQTKWDIIISSPLSRAKETAEIIGREVGANAVIVEPDLIEKDFGEASGTTKEERDRLYPDRNYPGMEEWEHVIKRTRAVLDRCTTKYADQNIVIVSHSSVTKALINGIEGGDKDKHGVSLHSCGVTIADYTPETGYRFDCINVKVE